MQACRVFALAIGLAAAAACGRACAQQEGGPGGPPPDQGGPPQAFPGSPGEAGGQGRQGGAGGQGRQGGPPALQQPAMTATGEYLFVLVGSTLYQFTVKELKLVNKTNLPDDRGTGRPGEAGGRPPQGEGAGGPARDGGGGPQAYSLEQAISDNAQLHTIAFSGLAFLTGDFGASTFLPPGKVCDFFGFQYMRDIDAAGKGHNPIFLDRVVGSVLYILGPENRKLLEARAHEEAAEMQKLALQRLPLIKAFHRQLAGEIPAGSAGLSKEEVARYVGDLFAYDAEVSYERAQLFGRIAASLTPEQKTYLAKMKFGDFNTWPAVDVEQYKLPRGTEKPVNVAYMSCASEWFSWYAGSVDADVYFCPERHGTYFGSFYMKDMPAMGKRDYDISTAVTGDSGKEFLNTLTEEQRRRILAIPGLQRNAMSEIVRVRRAISEELRRFRTGGQADKEKLLALGRRYGELDGEVSFLYATAFAAVNKSLTPEQRATLVKLRNLPGYTSAPAYLYSDPMRALPALPATDHFFFAPKGAAAGGFALRSPAVGADGVLPVEFTGDGESATPPLEWSGAPAATKSYTLIMHHLDPEGRTKWYWTLYNIPGDVHSLAKSATGVGTAGSNSVNGKVGYAPPHSKGPGEKTYVLTLYALSQPLQLAKEPKDVSREVLLDAMAGRVLATAELRTTYTRTAAGPPAQ